MWSRRQPTEESAESVNWDTLVSKVYGSRTVGKSFSTYPDKHTNNRQRVYRAMHRALMEGNLAIIIAACEAREYQLQQRMARERQSRVHAEEQAVHERQHLDEEILKLQKALALALESNAKTESRLVRLALPSPVI